MSEYQLYLIFLQCFSKCFFEALGVVNSEGSVREQGVMEIFSLFGDRDRIPSFVANCKPTKRDPCERAFEIYECYKTDYIPEMIMDHAKYCIKRGNMTQQEIATIKRRDVQNPSYIIKVSYFY